MGQASLRNRCPICLKPLKNIFLSMCRECDPSKFDKRKYPHQKLRQRKKWKERRLKLIEAVKSKCQICKKEFKKDLRIHHIGDELDSMVYQTVWARLLNKTIEKYVKSNQDYFDQFFKYHFLKNIKKTIKFFEKKNTQQRYKKTLAMLNRVIKNYELRKKLRNKSILKAEELAFISFIRKIIPIFYVNLVKKYNDEIEVLLDKYLNTNMVLILCKRCHYGYEKGYILCKLCKENYHKNQYEYCYKCMQKAWIFCVYCLKFFNLHDTEKCPICNRLYFSDNEFVEKIFQVSPKDLKYHSLEGENCFICGVFLLDEPQNTANYLIIKNSKKNTMELFGNFCCKCKEKFEKLYEPKDSDVITLEITSEI